MKRLFSILLLSICLSCFVIPHLSIDNTSIVYAVNYDEPPGIVEKGLSRSFNSLSTTILNLLNKELDVSIDKLVYNKQSALKISFEDGNRFAKVSIIVYEFFKYAAEIGMYICLINMGIKRWLSSTAENRKNFKEMQKNYLIAFIFIELLPILFIDITFIRDLILNALSPENMSGLSYVETLKQNAYESLKLGDSLMYATTVGISFWFTFIYGGLALQLIWVFALGALIALSLNGNRSRKIFDNWFYDFLNIIATPLWDAILLFIITWFIKGGLENFWGILFTGFIIPLRGLTKKYFGIGSFWGEMMGVSGLMGAANLTRSVVNTLRGGVSTTYQGIKEGKYADKLEAGGSSVFDNAHTTSYHQSKIGPVTPEEWRKQGRQKVGRGLGRMAVSAVGGLYGFGITAGLGPSAGMQGAAMGMEVGGVVGEGAGHLLGTFTRNNEYGSKWVNIPSNIKQSYSNEVMLLDNANSMAVGNVNTMAMDNPQYAYTEMPSTAVGKASSVSMDNIRPDMSKVMHIFSDIKAQPIDGEFLNMSYEKSKEYASSKVNLSEITSLRDNIADNYFNNKVKSFETFDIEYSIDDLKAESIDYANNQVGYVEAIREYNVHVDFANSIQKLDYMGNQLRENDYMKQFPGLAESIVQNSMNSVMNQYMQQINEFNSNKDISNENVI